MLHDETFMELGKILARRSLRYRWRTFLPAFMIDPVTGERVTEAPGFPILPSTAYEELAVATTVAIKELWYRWHEKYGEDAHSFRTMVAIAFGEEVERLLEKDSVL